MEKTISKHVLGYMLGAGLLAVVNLPGVAHAEGVAANGERYAVTPFFDDFDGPALNGRYWQVATWMEHNGQTQRSNVWIEDGILHLRLVQDAQRGVLSSAVQSKQEFLYGRWDIRMRPSDVPQVINAFYTIDWDDMSKRGSGSDGTKQEVDLEFLTRHRTGQGGLAHSAIHATGHKNAFVEDTRLAQLQTPGAFHVWTIEITPDQVAWSVDGQQFSQYDPRSGRVQIDRPYQVKFNHWTGGPWVGGPPPVGREAIFEIDWVRFTPAAN